MKEIHQKLEFLDLIYYRNLISSPYPSPPLETVLKKEDEAILLDGNTLSLPFWDHFMIIVLALVPCPRLHGTYSSIQL